MGDSIRNINTDKDSIIDNDLTNPYPSSESNNTTENNNNSDNMSYLQKNLSMIQRKGNYQFDQLQPYQMWGYALGHFYNDLCAACWFNYLVFDLKEIQGIAWAPQALLSGQVADALATPLVGSFSDKTNTRFGKRTPWYVFGIILVSLTFIPTFHKNLFIEWGWVSPDNLGMEVFYYILFPSLFNIGWASVQVSNMSLVPSLTCSRKKRDSLNSMRNTFTFVANLTVLFTALVFFQFIDDPVFCFELIAYVSTIIGLGTTAFYLISINEVELSNACQDCVSKLKKILLLQKQDSMKEMEENERIRIQSMEGDTLQKVIQDISQHPLGGQDHLLPQGAGNDDIEFEQERFQGDPKTNIRVSYRNDMNPIGGDATKRNTLSQEMTNWKTWFTQPQFYLFGVVYMVCRLYCNVLSTLINFYLIYVLQISTSEEMESQIPFQVALIPLLLFVSSVAASTRLDFFYNKFGRKHTFTFGTVLGLTSSVALALLNHNTSWIIYIVAIIIGASQSITLNTGIALISEVIGLKGEGGAFVYGCYSFLDKLMTGIVLFFITDSSYFQVDKGQAVPHSTEAFTRWTIVLVPGISLIIAWILIIRAQFVDYNDDGTQHNPLMGRQSLLDEFAN